MAVERILGLLKSYCPTFFFGRDSIFHLPQAVRNPSLVRNMA